MKIDMIDFSTKAIEVAQTATEKKLRFSEEDLICIHTCLNYISDNFFNYQITDSNKVLPEVRKLKAFIKKKLNSSELSPVPLDRTKLVKDLDLLHFFINSEMSAQMNA